MTPDIHSCSLYCDRPDCIKDQRDRLRDECDTWRERFNALEYELRKIMEHRT